MSGFSASGLAKEERPWQTDGGLRTESINPPRPAMNLDRCPRDLQAFLKPYASRLSKPQQRRLWMILVAWVWTGNVAKVVRWASQVTGRHRTSLAALLTRSAWDPAAI